MQVLLQLLLEYEHNVRISRKLVEITENERGSEHRDTLLSMNNLAILLKDLGKWREARALYERVLQGMEKAMGPEHPETLSSVNNLAVLLSDLGETAEARALYERGPAGTGRSWVQSSQTL